MNPRKCQLNIEIFTNFKVDFQNNLRYIVSMINNNELFAKVLAENPLPYHLGDKVNTNHGIGYISGYNFKDREKVWKFTIRPHGLDNYYTDVETVYGKVE